MKIYKINKTRRRLQMIFLLVGFLSVTTSCDQDFGDINDNWEPNLYEANIDGLMNGIIAKTVKSGDLHRIPTAWLYQWNQSAAMYSASGFRLDDKTTGPWKQFYQALAAAREIEKLIAENENAANMTNITATLKVLIANKVLETTLLYGDMPYTEAGYGFYTHEAYRPVYESQQFIFEAALNDLTWAVDNFSTSTTEIPLGGDTLFGGDIDKWIMYANSLRLRYAMTMRHKDEAFADGIISAALSKPLLSSGEDVLLGPITIPGLSINRDKFYRGNSYIRMGSTMFGEMSSTNAVDGSGIYDLRCAILFEPNIDNEWVAYPQNPDNLTPTVTGNPYARNRQNNPTKWAANRSNFAAINTYYVNERSIPQIVISGSEISFIKAELYNRGIAGVSVDHAMAESFYIEGITASVNYWYKLANSISLWVVNKPAAAPTPAELTAMLTNVNVAYNADAATALSQIYKQSWISLFHQPLKSWDLQRRTDATPGVALASTGLVNDFNRLTYPPSERETNRDNWMTITGGTDSEKVKTWIQK